MGIGGYPKGRIVEIYGPESSGKTTLALTCVAEVQKTGGMAAYIDAENALDPQYAEALGVNIDDLLLSQPDSGEEGLEMYNRNNTIRTAGEHFKYGRGAKMDDIDPDYGSTIDEIPRWKHPSKKELKRVQRSIIILRRTIRNSEYF